MSERFSILKFGQYIKTSIKERNRNKKNEKEEEKALLASNIHRISMFLKCAYQLQNVILIF